jgi:hypothetical protein
MASDRWRYTASPHADVEWRWPVTRTWGARMAAESVRVFHAVVHDLASNLKHE